MIGITGSSQPVNISQPSLSAILLLHCKAFIHLEIQCMKKLLFVLLSSGEYSPFPFKGCIPLFDDQILF